MNQELLYLDSSAIIKLVVAEPESESLFGFLRDWPHRVASELARTEVLRSLRRARVSAVEFRRGQEVLDRMNLIGVDSRTLAEAGLLQPVSLRSLDAIHLATALSLDALGALVTYDTRLRQAATAAGLTVLAPGAAFAE